MGGDGGDGVASFQVVVNGVAPTAAFASDGPVALGTPATVRFTNPYDPPEADTPAGFRYSYDFNDEGEAQDVSGAAWSYLVNTLGVHTVRGRITDHDGLDTDYYTEVTVILP